MNNLEQLYTAILTGKLDEAKLVTQSAINDSINPQDIINNYMSKAMEEIGQRFENGQAFVPELLMSARAMKGALEVLKPYMQGTSTSSAGRILIGTVKGDLHDIGKNLVASMLEGCGFEVVNLGVDLSSEKFVEAIKTNEPQIVCLSALLTTTMGYMEEVVKAIDKAGLRQQVKIMVGGAPVTAAFASQIGADGYSDNANAAVTLAKELIYN